MPSPQSLNQFPLRWLTVAIAAGFLSGPVLALPTGAQVANGTVAINQSGAVMTVSNSSGSIINWQGFSIGAGETVRFNQASANSSVLNRVVANNPSTLLGQLQSNGQVFLINPAGILVGQGARIDVASFVASTLNLSDADFLAKRFNFTETAGAGLVRNEGTITTPAGGSVYLIAPKVENAGLIQSPQGEVILAAGQTVQIGDTATPGVRVEVTGASTEASNMGSIVADAGRIGLVGAMVKNSGLLSASSAVSEGGRIFLKATQNIEQLAAGRIEANGLKGGTVVLDAGATTLVDGTVSATGSDGIGGTVQILGDKVGVINSAVVDASGTTGGGTILVGGDYQGNNPDVKNASMAYFGPDASLRADAITNGNGGKVIVWSDDTTRAYGKISARGGASGGDGGLVETSGKKYLGFDAKVDTSALKGASGTLLLDPFSVTIVNGPLSPIPNNPFVESSTTSSFSWSSIDTLLQSTNVTIQTTDSGATNDNIIIGSGAYPTAITASATATNKLILNANDDIIFDYGLTLKGGLQATAGQNITVNSDVKTDGSMSISAGNAINVGYSGMTNQAGLYMDLVGGSQTVSAGGAMTVTASYNPNSGAFVKSKGSQSVSATALTLTGGSGSGNTRAQIDADGVQTVTVSSGNLTLSGGSSSTSNGANIGSKTSQTINVSGNLNLTGGSTGEAIISAPVQNITVGGNLNMQGGSGTVAGGYGMAAPAAIGMDANSNITLNVTGTVTLTGTDQLNPALIGSAIGTSSLYLRGTGIDLGTYSFLGNRDGSVGGSITLRATSGLIQQSSTGGIRTGTLDAQAVGNVVLNGLNSINSANLVSNGLINFNRTNADVTHFSAKSGSGQITLTGAAGSGALALGLVDAGATGTVTITSKGAILDDNGNGTANVRGGTVVLNAGSSASGELSISTDVDCSGGTLTASVAAGSARGGVRIGSVGSAAPQTVTINDASGSAGDIAFQRYGDLTVGGNYQLNSSTGSALIGTAGRFDVNGGTVSAKGNLGLAAENMLIRNGGLVKSSGGSVLAGIGQDLLLQNGGRILAASDVKLKFASSTAKLALNDAPGLLPSSIRAGDGSSSPASAIYIDFLRRQSGGVMIDGVESTATLGGGSGFFVGGSPALLGTNLKITYGVPVDQNGVLLNDLLKTQPLLNSSITPQDGTTSLFGRDNLKLAFDDEAALSDEFGNGKATGEDNEGRKRSRRGGVCR